MKKLIEKYKKLYKNSSIFRIFLLLLIWALIIFEWRNIYIDYYNFQQLEKAKQVVENLKWEEKDYRVRDLKWFNYQFDADIEPLDKRYCYYVYYNKIPTGPWYIFNFWFKLHSLLYKIKYWWTHYNYPYKMEEPEPSKECLEELKLPWLRWAPSCVSVSRYRRFLDAINNPCRR
jgi:hypothetical protein